VLYRCIIFAIVALLAGCAADHVYRGPARAVERVRMDTSAGIIVLELDREKAPISVENFLAHTGRGAYDGTNVRGTIAMARETEPDSATREFYINVADNPRLDAARESTGNAGYTVFGRVATGMEVVDAIRSGATREIPDREMKDVPIEPVVIRSVRRIP
jgi:peptidyl-prolyl cis-trans isomerase A (cyclophilin A)